MFVTEQGEGVEFEGGIAREKEWKEWDYVGGLVDLSAFQNSKG